MGWGAPRRDLRLAYGKSAAVFIGTVLALVSPLSDVAVMTGTYVSSGMNREIKARTSSTIGSIAVREGQRVRAGDTLVYISGDEVAKLLAEVDTKLQSLVDAQAQSEIDHQAQAKLRLSSLNKLKKLRTHRLATELDITNAEIAQNDTEISWRKSKQDFFVRISDLRERRAALERQLSDLTLIAPENGYIQGLAGLSKGSIVSPGDVLMTVVTDRAPVILRRLDHFAHPVL